MQVLGIIIPTVSANVSLTPTNPGDESSVFDSQHNDVPLDCMKEELNEAKFEKNPCVT